MTPRLEQTRRKVIFGAHMQMLRERCEPRITPDLAAKEVHSAKSTITRMEGGYTVPSFLLVSTLLGIYGASAEERDRAEQLRLAAKANTTRVEHVADMPPKYRAFRRDEAEAVRERTFDTVIIPGLLQTPAYAAEVWNAARRLSRSGAGDAIAVERQSRQALLTQRKPPLVLHALIDQFALSREIGSPAARIAQLDHVLSMAAMPNVTVQVIPRAAGAYGPLSGPMILLDYGADAGPDVAYLEYIAGGETVANVDDVVALSAVWDEISTIASSPNRSTDIIREIRNLVEENE
jgi:hypothetical protein